MYPPKPKSIFDTLNTPVRPDAFTAGLVNQPPTVSKKVWTNADLPKSPSPVSPQYTNPTGMMDIMDDGSDPTPDVPVNAAPTPAAPAGPTPVNLAGPNPEPSNYFDGFVNSILSGQAFTANNPQPQSDNYWGGVWNSIKSGESRNASMAGLKGFAKGAIADLPQTAMSMLETLYNLTPENAGQLVTGIPEQLRALGEAAMFSGSKPEEFGRMLGQMTGQPAVTAGLAKAVPPIVQAAGTPTAFVGQQMQRNAPFSGLIPSAMEPRILRPLERFAGAGVEKLGNAMKGVGTPATAPPSPVPSNISGTVPQATTATTAQPSAAPTGGFTARPMGTTTSMPMTASVPVKPAPPTPPTKVPQATAPPPTPPPVPPAPAQATSTAPAAAAAPNPVTGAAAPAEVLAAKHARYGEIVQKAQTGALTAAEQAEAQALKTQLDMIGQRIPNQPPVPPLPKPKSSGPPVQGELFEKPPAQSKLNLEPEAPPAPPVQGFQPELPFEQPGLPFSGTPPPVPSPPASAAPTPAPAVRPIPTAAEMAERAKQLRAQNNIPEPSPAPAPPTPDQVALRAKLQQAWDNVPPMEIPPTPAKTPVTPAKTGRVRQKTKDKGTELDKNKKIEEPPAEGVTAPTAKPKPKPAPKVQAKTEAPPKPDATPKKGWRAAEESLERRKKSTSSITEPTTKPKIKAKSKADTKLDTKVAEAKKILNDKPDAAAVRKAKVAEKRRKGEPLTASEVRQSIKDIPPPKPKPPVSPKDGGITDPKVKEAYRLQREADAKGGVQSKVTPKTEVTAPTVSLKESLKQSLEAIGKKRATPVSKTAPSATPQPTALKAKTTSKTKNLVEMMKKEGDALKDLTPEQEVIRKKFMSEVDNIVKEKGHITPDDIKSIQAKIEAPTPGITSPANKPRLIKTKKKS